MTALLLFALAVALVAPIQGFGTIPSLRVSQRSLGGGVVLLFAEPSYHKGGNARYQAPVVVPARLENDQDCEEPFIDHATGDEL